jgi:endonuclease/exonuclease/phosphatase family metal-dependent hydrolase
MNKAGELRVATFNMLAPCYKREGLNANGRSTREKDIGWMVRARQSVEFFRKELLGNFQLISLQEFWLEPEYEKMFRNVVNSMGYALYTFRRHPTQKEDAVAIMIKKNELQVKNYEHIHLCQDSNRVALILWVLHLPTGQHLIVGNTHLSFPHTPYDEEQQVNQIEQIIKSIDRFAEGTCKVPHATKMIMGDFNEENKSQVCEHLRSQGYVSCLEACPPAAVIDRNSGQQHTQPSSSSIVTHRNHLNQEVFVDHIFIKPETYGQSISDAQAKDNSVNKYLVPGAKVPGLGIKLPKEEKEGEPYVKKAIDGIYASDTMVLPQSLSYTVWEDSFSVSDHRPVGTNFVFGSRS